MKVVRFLWKLLVGIKDAMVLVLLLLFFGALYAALSVRPQPTVPGSGALLVDLDGALVEQPAETDAFSVVAGGGPASREYRLRDLVRGLRAAATDLRVKAVVLDLDRFTGGEQATIADAGQALDAVRRAGKPVLAYATGYDDDAYQLAAHASEVWLDPLGAVLLAGPGGPRLYYKGLLDKLGVEARVYRVGTYKSAVEPFILTGQSPAARAANQALADTLWATWQDEVARARPRAQVAAYARDPVAALAAGGGDDATAALRAGLVDRLGDRLAFEARVAQLVGASPDLRRGGYRRIDFADWAAANPARATGPGIGIVTVAGTIVDGRAPPGTAGGETIARLILDELARKRLHGLVVRIDSPGGSVTASERIRSAILAVKRTGVPVAVSMGGVAASGGYWLATPGDRIFADPATITGSIGVFGLIPTFRGALGKTGLSADGVATTPLSGQPDVLRGPSATFDRLIQASIESIYRRFTGLVAEARRLPVARVDEIGQGRVWAGGTARQLGLVDQFGTVDDAVAWVARRGGLDPATVRPIYIERERSGWRGLIADLARRERDRDTASTDVWSRVAGTPRRLLARAFADAQALARGPAIQVRCLECGPVATGAASTAEGLLARFAR